jgi:hypothetical protein
MLSDMSHTERIRFIRNRTLAIWKRTGSNLPEEGPRAGNPESTRSARALGQKTYIRQNAGSGCGGPSVTTIPPPCCN